MLTKRHRLVIQTVSFHYFNNCLYKRMYSFAERPQLLSLFKARYTNIDQPSLFSYPVNAR